MSSVAIDDSGSRWRPAFAGKEVPEFVLERIQVLRAELGDIVAKHNYVATTEVADAMKQVITATLVELHQRWNVLVDLGARLDMRVRPAVVLIDVSLMEVDDVV